MDLDKISRRRLLLAATVMVLHSPAKATCVYSFSYYDNVYFSSDGKSLVSSVSVVDNSNCNHSQYTTTAKISSPSGRLATQSQSGLSATVQILINGETGTFSPLTTGTFYCPAVLGFAGFGNGWSVSVGNRITYYKNPTGGYGADCTWHSLACSSGSPSCANGFVFGIYFGACPAVIKVDYQVLIVNGQVEFCDFFPLVTNQGPGPCT